MPDDPAPPPPSESRPLVWVCLAPEPGAVPEAVRLRRLLKLARRLGFRCVALADAAPPVAGEGRLGRRPGGVG